MTAAETSPVERRAAPKAADGLVTLERRERVLVATLARAVEVLPGAAQLRAAGA